MSPGRESVYDILFKPRWKPWSPRKVALSAIGFGLLMSFLVVAFPKAISAARIRFFTVSPVAAAEPSEGPVAAAETAPDRADAALVRKGRSPIAGGVLALPTSFASADGGYDLVVHFHGNPDLVEESYNLVGINAVVVILNLGIGSGAYEERFASPLGLQTILERADNALSKRGLRRPALRRLGLTAWSAGYGAVLRILEQPALAEKVDSVVLLDGIHCGYKPGGSELWLERIAPFERFAREAVEGKRLLSITHSEITPMGGYAGTRVTTDALLELVGVSRTPGGDAPPMPVLHSIEGVIPRKMMRPLVPRSQAHRGGLYVRGYAGTEAPDHNMHLVHMATTALPDLVSRWKTPVNSVNP